ncbi:MAG TPA: BlaI/MecI/CopY family transcriptional regulator [Acidobacteriota bacterium]|nr:BlaI/MecI/CopY family transcriptional regulator [Acidobacteriota bacterium]
MKLTGVEWELMKVIWRKSPVSARQVLEAVRQEKDWAYSTVKTMLDRLVEKGALASEMKGNTAFYRPLLSQEKARRSAVGSLVEKAFDGAFGHFMAFLLEEEKLSPEERRELARRLEKLSQKESSDD